MALVPSNRLVNINNTIAGAGQFGVGQLALTNSGTINANATKSLTIDLGSQTGLNQSKGLIESTAAGGLTVNAGLITNSGTMLASNGSKLTFLPSAVLTNNASGVLTAVSGRPAETVPPCRSPADPSRSTTRQ